MKLKVTRKPIVRQQNAHQIHDTNAESNVWPWVDQQEFSFIIQSSLNCFRGLFSPLETKGNKKNKDSLLFCSLTHRKVNLLK